MINTSFHLKILALICGIFKNVGFKTKIETAPFLCNKFSIKACLSFIKVSQVFLHFDFN